MLPSVGSGYVSVCERAVAEVGSNGGSARPVQARYLPNRPARFPGLHIQYMSGWFARPRTRVVGSSENMKHHHRAFWLLLASTCAFAQASAQPDLILILDASNSMWGQIEGENKIVIARRAVGGLVDDLPDDARVGLLAYGHRREGDCADIEVLSEPGLVDKAALKGTINAIKPKGKTPITASINAAIELARKRDASAIVLISDGLETCELDPCAAVRTAKSEGVPFVLHVIGFDVANEDTSQLECAAQAGEGLFLTADNAAELSDALISAYEKPTVPEGRLVITATAGNELEDVAIQVLDRTTGAQVASARTYVSSDTNPRSIPLEDGKYKVTVAAVRIGGAPKQEFEIEVAGGNRIERSFDFSAGEVSVLVTRNGELSDATVSARASGEKAEVASGRTYRSSTSNPRVFSVPAGTYEVVVKSIELENGSEQHFDEVVVLGGKRTELVHDFSSGVLKIGVRRGDSLVDSSINVYERPGRGIGGGRTYASPKSNPLTMIVSPGDYSIRVNEIRGERREVEATVTAGEATEVLVDLDQP